MLLFAKQWGRIAGCVAAALIFLFTLRSLDVLRPYPELLNSLPQGILKGNDQDTQHPGEAEAKVDTFTGSDVNAHDDFKLEDNESWTAQTSTSVAEDLRNTLSPEATTTAVHHIWLEGTRRPDGVSTTVSEASGEIATPTAGETSPAADPSSMGFTKTIVMGKLSEEDTQWVKELQDWQSAIYVVDLADNETSPTGFKTAVNKAKESTPYLTYIVDHYDSLPDVAVFVHSHRNGWPAAWHNDAKGYDAVNMLNQLRIEAVLDRGFVNLRCIGDPGCPAEINLNRSPPDKSKHAEIAYPFVYSDMFNITIDQVREQIPIVATPCCAQFAVSKEQVMKRPKSEYERYLQLIRDSKYDDETLGTVMEYTWHLMFGQEAVHCEDTQQCWKIVYGREEGWNNFGR